jgi:signal transduction histidine kinase
MFEAFLRQVPLFADLPEEDLRRLCQMAQELHLKAGEILLREGEVADKAYILHEGELEIIKNVDGREVLLDTRSIPGTVVGEMALLEEGTRLATVRAGRDSLVLALGLTQVDELFNLNPKGIKVMLSTLMRNWQGSEAELRHSQRMAQLGTFTAGIAHELNNPAAAVLRGVGQLKSLWAESLGAQVQLSRLELSPQQGARIEGLEQQLEQTIAHPLTLDSLTRSDREAEIESWLSLHNLSDAWEWAPVLVSLGFEPAHLDELAAAFAPGPLAVLLEWLFLSHSSQNLLNELSLQASRISGLVNSLKSYAYLGQAPMQEIDIHMGLDDTLSVLGSKLAHITIQRNYAPHLPRIPAYGSELNQVWTNLLDNAVDALGDHGQITLRTKHEGDIIVEVEDNGPGIAAQHLPKIFDPFFTTKPPGKGAGLGLSISYNIIKRHKGTLGVRSEPGRTVFEVRLPIADV